MNTFYDHRDPRPHVGTRVPRKSGSRVARGDRQNRVRVSVAPM